MIDADEFAAYEMWREARVLGQVDVSVHAFNAEQEGLALAWEAGVMFAIKADNGLTTASIEAANPYRGAGMTGARPAKRVTS
jgi:hypothetical protein